MTNRQMKHVLILAGIAGMIGSLLLAIFMNADIVDYCLLFIMFLVGLFVTAGGSEMKE